MLTAHKINPANDLIEIEPDARDEANGNASHNYTYSYEAKSGFTVSGVIMFQHGPIAENGINGLTNEVLLAIVADRLAGFQSSKWACTENQLALLHVRGAIEALHLRTLNRMRRGVEGTHEV